MMRNRLSRLVFVLMMIVALALATLPVTPAYAAACLVDTSTTWSALTCGTGGGVPTAADTVEIRNGATLTVNVNNAVAASVQAGGGGGSGPGIGTLTFNSGSSLTVSGSVILGGLNTTRGGTIDMTAGGILTANSLLVASGPTWIPGTGTVILAATNTLPGTTFTTFNNLIISGGTTTTGANTTISGNLSIGNGATFSADAFALTVAGTTTVGGGTSGSLTISSATGAKTFNGLVTINPGGTWTNTAANSAVTFHGGITNNGTFNAGTGIHTFDTSAQALAGTLSIPRLTVTGVTVTNNGTLTVGTALAGTGGLTNSATGTLNIGGTSTITTLTATAVGNTVDYNGAAQTVLATAYDNLIFSGSGAKSVATSTSVAGNLSIASGAAQANIGAGLNIGVGSLTLGGLGRINGTWGSTSSAATHTDNTYFAATTGIVTVSTDTRITSTTTVTCGAGPFTYDGSAQTPCSVSVTGAGGLNLTPAPVYANNVDAGTASASYTYAGDVNYTGSSDSKTFVIAPAASTTTVTCPASVTYDGTAQTPCTATVTGVGGLNQSLTVNYSNNTNAGTATASASFAGDANHASSTDSKTFVIDPANTTTNLISSGSPSVFGQLVTFTATVAPAAATGTVQFYADGVTLGSAPALSGGTASASTAALPVGTHIITATYSGDLNFNTSTSATLVQQVSAGCAAVTGADFSFSPAVPKVGQPVNFTATVTGGTVPVTYTWNFGYGADVPTTVATIAHSFPLTTTVHTYDVTLSAANACTSPAAPVSKQVTVWPYGIYLPLILR